MTHTHPTLAGIWFSLVLISMYPILIGLRICQFDYFTHQQVHRTPLSKRWKGVYASAWLDWSIVLVEHKTSFVDWWLCVWYPPLCEVLLRLWRYVIERWTAKQTKNSWPSTTLLFQVCQVNFEVHEVSDWNQWKSMSHPIPHRPHAQKDNTCKCNICPPFPTLFCVGPWTKVVQ